MQLMNPGSLFINKLLSEQKNQLLKLEYDQDQINSEFEQRIETLLKAYKKSASFTSNKPGERSPLTHKEVQSQNILNKASPFQQMYMITKRALLNERRSPFQIRMKIV